MVGEEQSFTARFRLVVARGECQGRSFVLEQGTSLIGRWDPDSGAFPEVDLDAEDVEAKVSRKHATIECDGQRLWLTDLGSRNGTYINRGARLSPTERHELQLGDEIIVGKIFLRLELAANE